MPRPTQTQTDTKTKPKFDFDNIFKTNTFSAPTLNPNRTGREEPAQQGQRQRQPNPLDAMTPTTPLPQINVDGLEADDIDDATAARNAGRTRIDQGDVEPVPPTPTTQLANIVRDIAAGGNVNPEFRSVSDLPGYMVNAIRRIGRTVFSVYTTTPIEQIDVLANVGGQGPNTMRELNAVAGWARNNATLDQQASEAATTDFGNVIPGYAPQIQVYDAGETTFMITRDDHGSYIYSWPSDTNIERNIAGLLPGQRRAPAGALPHLESVDFKTFLVLHS